MDLDLRRRLLQNVSPGPTGEWYVRRDDGTVFCTCATLRSARRMLETMEAEGLSLDRKDKS